jgi:spore germination cell wall hydrolase CwlJ-like protein
LSLFVQARDRARALTVGAVSGAGVGLVIGAAVFAAALAPGAASSAQTIRLSEATRRALADAATQHQTPQSAAQPRVAIAAPGPEKLTAPTVFTAADPTTSASPRELECLTAAVYFEARGESPAGQEAVAQVVLNRVRHPAFPKSICGVVYQGAVSHACQFSFVCDGQMRRAHESAAWTRAHVIAARALDGYVMAGVGRATHFHVTRLGHIWGPGMVRVARVGGHDFYAFGPQHGFSSARIAAAAHALDAAATVPVRLTDPAQPPEPAPAKAAPTASSTAS